MSELRKLVSKLNDRNIQESRESGFTLYVILAILAAVVQQIISRSGDIYSIINDTNTVEVMLLTWVLAEGVHLVVASFILKVAFFKEIRIISYSINRKTILEGVVKIIQLLIPVVLSSYIIYSGFRWFPVFAFIAYAGLFLLYSLTSIIKYYNSGPSSTKILEDSGFSTYKTKRNEIIWFCIGVIFIVTSLIGFLYYNSVFSDSTVVSIIEYTILFFILLFVSNVALNLYKKSIVNNMLKDLEAQIYLNDLSDETITDKLHDQFIGISLDDWITKKSSQIQWSYIENSKLIESIIDKWLPRAPDEKLFDRMLLARDKFTTEVTIVHQEIVNIAYRDKHVYTELDDVQVQNFINHLHSKITEFDIHMETRYDSLSK